MGGDWKRDTLQTPPNIPPRNTHPPPHNVCGGRGDSSSGQKKHKELRKNEKKKKGSFQLLLFTLAREGAEYGRIIRMEIYIMLRLEQLRVCKHLRSGLQNSGTDKLSCYWEENLNAIELFPTKLVYSAKRSSRKGLFSTFEQLNKGELPYKGKPTHHNVQLV